MNKPAISATLLLPMVALVGAIEAATAGFSHFIGSLRCGDSYLQPANNIVGEQSCGSDVDVYFISGLVLAATVALLVLLLTDFGQRSWRSRSR